MPIDENSWAKHLSFDGKQATESMIPRTAEVNNYCSTAALGIARAQLAADRARASAAAAALAAATQPQPAAPFSDSSGPVHAAPSSPIRSAAGALSPTRLSEEALRRHMSDSPGSTAGSGSGSFAESRSPVGRSRSRAGFDPSALPFHCAADYFYATGGGHGGGHDKAVVRGV
jgi:hypothetical protein